VKPYAVKQYKPGSFYILDLDVADPIPVKWKQSRKESRDQGHFSYASIFQMN